MDNRKTYVRPAVESEVMVEQTSLACNLIMWPDESGTSPVCGPSFHSDCFAIVSKDGSFGPGGACQSVPMYSPCAVQYS